MNWAGARREFGQAREGNEIPDIGETEFWVECSSGRTIDIATKLVQGLSASSTTPHSKYRDMPTAVVSKHEARGLTMVTMTLDAWLELTARAIRADRTKR